jgi:hypothetical protein
VRGLVADALRVEDDGRLVHIDLHLGHSARSVSEPQRRVLSDLASGLRARNVAVNTIASDDDRAPDPQMISALTAFVKFLVSKQTGQITDHTFMLGGDLASVATTP